MKEISSTSPVMAKMVKEPSLSVVVAMPELLSITVASVRGKLSSLNTMPVIFCWATKVKFKRRIREKGMNLDTLMNEWNSFSKVPLFRVISIELSIIENILA